MGYADNKTYYEILGISTDATSKDIQLAKDRLKFGSQDERVPFSMWSKIDEAYNVLIDANKRMEYDKKIFNERETLSPIVEKKEELPIESFNKSTTSVIPEEPKNDKFQNNSYFEISMYEEYRKNLEKEIEKLLNGSYNSYKLSLCESKIIYVIRFLEKYLDVKQNTRIRNSMQQIEISNIKEQLNYFNRMLNEIKNKMTIYDSNKTSTLSTFNN